MTPRGRVIVALLIIALIAGWGILSRRDGSRGRPSGQLQPAMAPAGEATGFARAEGPRPLDFPADHGPHPDFQTEWWYYTGNVRTEEGRASATN